MSPGPRRRAGAARSAAVLAAATALLLLTPATVAAGPAPGVVAAAGATARLQVEPEAPVQVLVSTLEPRAPLAGDTVRVAGRLTNTGSQPVRALRVRLRVGPTPLISRSALDQADREGALTRRVSGADLRLDPEPVPPGGSVAFSVQTDVASLGLDRDGVYALQVEVQGGVADGPRAQTLGLASTFLPFFAAPTTGTTRIAWLWPLVATPAQSPRATPRGPLLLDDALGEALAENGRLEALLRAARGAEVAQCDPPREAATRAGGPPCRAEPVPVTYAVDPDLLLTVQGMAGSYDLRMSESRTAPGERSEAARRWLDALRLALADRTGGPSDLLALPYADVDVVSLAGTPLAEDVASAVDEGRRVAQQVTGRAPLDAVGWAPPGPVPPDALGAYRLAGTRTLVVQESALPPRPASQTRTSPAQAPLRTATGRLDGLVVDQGLTDLLRAPNGDRPEDDRWQGARVAEQRFLVETAIIAAEAPEATRTLVVAPPREAEVVPAVVAQAMLDTGRVPWLCPVRLSAVVAGEERCTDAAAPGGTAAPEPEDRGAPVVGSPMRLPEDQLASLAPTRRAIDQLTLGVLAPSDEAAETRTRLLRGAFRAESVAWRAPSDAPAQGRLLAALLADDVADLRGRVKLLTGPVTLTSSSGSLDVTVENTLDQAVDVRVRLSAPNEARLGTTVTEVQAVPARTSVQVRVRAEPRTSGQFPVRVQLLDRDGDAFSAPSTFVVRSTRYGPLALAVTAAGAGVLLVAVGVRIVRRALGAPTGSFGRRRRATGDT